jgi:hypothetical protein
MLLARFIHGQRPKTEPLRLQAMGFYLEAACKNLGGGAYGKEETQAYGQAP